MSELKACPFCGGSEFEFGFSYRSPFEVSCAPYMICKNAECGYRMDDCDMDSDDTMRLIGLHNRRPIEDAQRDRIAELEQKLAAALERGKKLETALREIADSPSGEGSDADYMQSVARAVLSAAQPSAPKHDAGDGEES